MDSILDFFVKQKKLALVFTVSVIAVGLLALSSIQRDQFPAVDFEVMSISTAYPGASPEDVEQNVTNLIEDELVIFLVLISLFQFLERGAQVLP